MSSATKGTPVYREKIERAAKWLDGSHIIGDEPCFRIMNKIFYEGLEVLELLREFKFTINNPEDEVSQKILEIDIKSVLLELKKDKSKASLKRIFSILDNRINEFYSLTLEEHDMTHAEREFKRKWKSEIESLGF